MRKFFVLAILLHPLTLTYLSVCFLFWTPALAFSIMHIHHASRELLEIPARGAPCAHGPMQASSEELHVDSTHTGDPASDRDHELARKRPVRIG